MEGGQPNSTYRVVLTRTAIDMLRRIKRQRGRQTYEQLKSVVMELASNPLQRTQPLTGLLRECRSFHSGRFRIVLRVRDAALEVWVVGVGWHTSGDRDDVYRVLERLAASGRLQPPKE